MSILAFIIFAFLVVFLFAFCVASLSMSLWDMRRLVFDRRRGPR